MVFNFKEFVATIKTRLFHESLGKSDQIFLKRDWAFFIGGVGLLLLCSVLSGISIFYQVSNGHSLNEVENAVSSIETISKAKLTSIVEKITLDETEFSRLKSERPKTPQP